MFIRDNFLPISKKKKRENLINENMIFNNTVQQKKNIFLSFVFV